ncbi:MAG: segregation/condensation protein A [Defluviitaleaceae bacterium]|nr:segregation/condensation protein A [Defluviitaleaceae bacterium]MCL2835450.1 segregation/condensation protein A [Defluviitaleaceae bacterium]
MAGFNVKIDIFDGPLDLLLHLLDKHEVDIFDIPIAPIAEQYLLYVKSMDGLDMDALSGFLVMAATLLSIKARMLLPRTVGNAAEEESDPRQELVNRLIDYKQYKERAELFAQREKTGILALYRDRDGSIDWSGSAMMSAYQPITGIVSIERLRAIFEEVLARRERRTDKIRSGFGAITVERFTISDRMAHITEKLRRGGRISFYALFDCSSTRGERVVTFLALLELIRQRRVAIIQDGLFNDIFCEGINQ